MLIVGAFLAIVWPSLAHADTASAWQDGPRADVRLVSATTAVGEMERVPLGLEVRLADHWKTYWRSPGDAGIPVQLDWSGSANLSRTDFAWPAPVRFSYFDIETVGYTDHVVFPIAAVPSRPGEALSLRTRVDMLVCDDVCIPHSFDLALDLPAGDAGASDHANLIDRFASRVPGDGSRAGLSFEGSGVSGPAEAPVVQAVFRAEAPFEAPDLLVEGGPDVVFDRPEFEIRENGRLLLASVGARDALGEGAALDGDATPLIFTLIDGSRAMETGPVELSSGLSVPLVDASDPAGGPDGLWIILGLALLGGLILNLMPCVLPVLSIKLLSVVSHGGGEPRRVRAGFLATTAGILVSFLALAAGLIALKQAGVAIGWGIQFQQPVFITVLVAILTLFAANLLGLFEIRLPGRVSEAAVAASHGHSLTAQFFQGAFATLLATPCSAPFLGTAVGFALSRGPVEIVTTFAALGLGMAAPFLLVALFPTLATWLPRPGAWMVWLRRGLALALIATAAWLVTVLARQLPMTAVVAVALLAVLVLAMLALRSRHTGSGRGWFATGAVLALVLAVLVPAAPASLYPGEPAAPARSAGPQAWVPFDRDRIDALVAGGKTVLVDVTAEWCITCQVNKARVLDSGELADMLSREDVVLMQADWTRPDAAISRFLASYERFGVPFNIVYGPARPQGVVLPELLAVADVRNAVAAASGPATSGIAER